MRFRWLAMAALAAVCCLPAGGLFAQAGKDFDAARQKMIDEAIVGASRPR